MLGEWAPFKRGYHWRKRSARIFDRPSWEKPIPPCRKLWWLEENLHYLRQVYQGSLYPGLQIDWEKDKAIVKEDNGVADIQIIIDLPLE